MMTLETNTFLLAHSVNTVLAQAEPIPPEGPEFGKASPVGIPVVLIMLIAIFVLVRGMNKRIKNLPSSFDVDSPEADQLADEGTDRAGVEGDDAAGPTDSDRSAPGTSSPA